MAATCFEKHHSVANLDWDGNETVGYRLSMSLGDCSRLSIKGYLVMRADEPAFSAVRWKHWQVFMRANRNKSVKVFPGFDKAIRNPTMFYGNRLHFPELVCITDRKLYFHSGFSFAHVRVQA